MRIVLLFLLLISSWKINSQDVEFLRLVDKFKDKKTLIDSLTAKKFIGVDYQKMKIKAFTDKIVFRNTFYIGLSFSFPCPASAICDRSLLIVFDYNGIKVDRLADFEYEFADCSYDESKRCIYSSDSLLVIVRNDTKNDCGLNKIIDRELLVESYKVDRFSGKIYSPKIDTIDTRRKYYNLSYQFLDKDFLAKSSKNELAIMRNELFASHGYKFKNIKWIDYFSNTDWYSPKENYVDDKFTFIESSNLKLIMELEKKN